jgi:uncharacterized protein YbcI
MPSFFGPSAEATTLSSVTEVLVHLHHRYYGKGPSKAKSYLLDTALVCMLAGGFTPLERVLIEAGRGSTVDEMRQAFHSSMQDQFCSTVADLTGRTVIAFLSQTHTDPDISVMVFVLA